MPVHPGPLLHFPPIHPGLVLLFVLHHFAISQRSLAAAMQIKPTNLSALVHGRRDVTVRLAQLLAMALGTRPEFWLLRQLAWDLAHAEAPPAIALMQELARFSQARPKFWLERQLLLELGQPDPASPDDRRDTERHGLELRRADVRPPSRLEVAS